MNKLQQQIKTTINEIENLGNELDKEHGKVLRGSTYEQNKFVLIQRPHFTLSTSSGEETLKSLNIYLNRTYGIQVSTVSCNSKTCNFTCNDPTTESVLDLILTFFQPNTPTRICNKCLILKKF